MEDNGNIHLGPRQVVVGGRVIGSIDDVILEITQASESELKKLMEAQSIQLVRISKG